MNGPPRMPDYVIICASGLYEQCSDAIDALAEHRRDLNNFDVALVTTGDIVEDFKAGQEDKLTASMIREFTEHMWNNWTQTSGKKPSYLLLIGDHEDSLYSDEPWFLPTHEYPCDENAMIGNDGWYTYFKEPATVDNAMPSMFVGRLSVKNGGEYEPDTLSSLIYNLIDLEEPIQQAPLVDYRRRILRLAGTGDNQSDTVIQVYGINNTPSRIWTAEFTNWLGYDYANRYCGDGRNFTYDELSLMKSEEWVDACLTEFGRGAGVAFYTDHGSTHLFSAGLEWWPRWIEDDPFTKGSLDSTFNNYQIENNLIAAQYHSAPFVLLLCCSSGSFNHTLFEHETPSSWPELCFYEGVVTPPVSYDFGTDCIAEKLLKKTEVPVAGVFCGSQPSLMASYDWYGRGILEAIYVRGHGRLGDAIASARNQFEDHFFQSTGDGNNSLGQFNLLGDPALDISDRVRYPNCCDLSVYSGEFSISQYPEETSTGLELPLSFTVRNNGAQDSDECDIRLTLRNGTNSSVFYLNCDPIDSGDSLVIQYTWDCSAWFQPPMDLTVSVEADYNEECDDSWRGNNSGSVVMSYNDTYPVLAGWILKTKEVISTTPVLANIDNDSDLEIIALVGNTLTAFDNDGSEIWTLSGESLNCSSQILSSDLNGDGESEFILNSANGIKVIDSDGDVLQTLQVISENFCVGEMESTRGLELCTAVGNTLYLYTWNSSLGGFVTNSSKQLSFSPAPSSYAMASNDLNGNSYEDVVYCCGYVSSSTPPTGYNALVVYDWETGGAPYTKTRSDLGLKVTPAAGRLGSDDLVGWPYGTYDHRFDPPAVLIEPDGTLEENCTQGDCDADRLEYAVFADWDEYSGADAFVLPSEMQALAWDYLGDAFDPWPTLVYQDAELGSSISPTALGNIDNAIYDDVLFSTELDGNCTILSYNYSAQLIGALDFPITLPDDVASFGGFSIADIDRDGMVELVFGTSDGFLHCWELGSCSTGYAPWTQFQHDDGRTGVLE
jgi:hypothetical protein